MNSNHLQKPIAILGAPGTFCGSAFDAPDRIFARTGLNTGNLAFFYAVQRHIANPTDYLPWTFDPELVNEHFSALIFPAANMINSFQDHGALAERFSKIKIPTGVVGIGAQNYLGADPASLKLAPGTIRFIEVLRDHDALIGCRGVGTQQILNNFGLEAQVIGCPSNFINPAADLGARVASKRMSTELGIFGHCDFQERLSSINQKLVRWVEEYGGVLSFQDPKDGFLLSMRSIEVFSDQNLLSKAARILGVDIDLIPDLIKRRFVAFVDLPSWLIFTRSLSLSIGTRMHGNMIAFQGEVPTVLIPHDSRVSELAETIMMPSVSLAAAMDSSSLDHLLSMVQFDAAEYDRNRQILARRYFSILASLGVDVRSEYLPLLGQFANDHDPVAT
jgi:hypothetical protein